jgi:hypothetical protein
VACDGNCDGDNGPLFVHPANTQELSSGTLLLRLSFRCPNGGRCGLSLSQGLDGFYGPSK